MEKQFNIPAWKANIIMGNTLLLDYWLDVFPRQLPIPCGMHYMLHKGL